MMLIRIWGTLMALAMTAHAFDFGNVKSMPTLGSHSAPAFRRAPYNLRRVAPTVLPVRMGAEKSVQFAADLDGSDSMIGIVKCTENEKYTASIIDGIKASLKECGVPEENIFEYEVPSAFNLPVVCQNLAQSATCEVILPVACFINEIDGSDSVIEASVAKGIMTVGLRTSVPCLFSVLTVQTEQQALDRSAGPNNHGLQWGKTAVEMVQTRRACLRYGKYKTKRMILGEEAEVEVLKTESNDDRPGQFFGF